MTITLTNHVVRTAYLEPTARIGDRTEHDAVGACVASRSVSDHTVAEGVRVAGILCARGSPGGCAAARSTGEIGGGARVSGSALEKGALFLWIEGAS